MSCRESWHWPQCNNSKNPSNRVWNLCTSLPIYFFYYCIPSNLIAIVFCLIILPTGKSCESESGTGALPLRSQTLKGRGPNWEGSGMEAGYETSHLWNYHGWILPTNIGHTSSQTTHHVNRGYNSFLHHIAAFHTQAWVYSLRSFGADICWNIATRPSIGTASSRAAGDLLWI